MTDLGKGAAWIDGQIIPIAEAKIGVTDLGFTHSDVTYDVAQVWDGGFFRLEDHLDRFEASMKSMYFSIPQSRDDIRQIRISIRRPPRRHPRCHENRWRPRIFRCCQTGWPVALHSPLS